jgi:hypothetical protein
LRACERLQGFNDDDDPHPECSRRLKVNRDESRRRH